MNGDDDVMYATTQTDSHRLGEQGERLLRALYDETVAGFHRQEPPSRPFDEIAQRAGLATVGAPETKTALAAMAFRDLETLGVVERVKVLDEPIHYRITRLGERAVMQQILEGAVKDARALATKAAEDAHSAVEDARAMAALHSQVARAAIAEVQAASAGLIAVLQQEIDWLRQPWWKRWFREPPALRDVPHEDV